MHTQLKYICIILNQRINDLLSVTLCTPVTHHVNISEGTVNPAACHMESVISPESSVPRQYLCFQTACCKSHAGELMLYSLCCCLFAFGRVEADITADNEKVCNV